jgi:hypothetical protein
MIGMTDPTGAIVMMIGDSMGRLGGERPFMIGWGAGSVCTKDSAIVLNIFVTSPMLRLLKFGSCHHEHCIAYLLSTLLCIHLKQVYFEWLCLGN